MVRTYAFDAMVVLGTIAAAVGVAVRGDSALAPGTPLWFAVAAVMLVILPLLLRHRFPFAAPAALWVVAAALSFVDGRLIANTGGAFLAGFVAAFLLGHLRDPVACRGGLAVVIGGAGVIAYNSPDLGTSQMLFVPLMFTVGWLGGYALRERVARAEAAEERATQAEHERETTARIAVAEERARIARELHDVVAHAVSVMVLQVGAVRHQLPQSLGEEVEALERVERAGRTALAEMRRLLGAMRGDDDEPELTPQPGLDGIESLLRDVGSAGLLVQLHVDGEPFPLPPAVDVSAYRIVQEGLTNVLKHAQAEHADVTLRYSRDELQIEVSDDGRGSRTGDGLGHGLLGVRERVKIFGGEMTVGAGSEGGFVLITRLPLGQPR
jgi:signal transduction histidine kinase